MLAVDCAVGNGSIAILRGETLLATSVDGSPARAEEILVIIRDLLVGTKSNLSDIDAMAVSVGPGSYSGIRIGIATATGLAAALSVPCLGVSTLSALSLSVKANGRSVTAVPVGKRHLGWLAYDVEGGGATPVGEPGMETDDRFCLEVESVGAHSVVCDRSVASRVRAVMPTSFNIDVPEEDLAELIGRFAYVYPDHCSLRPIYLRDKAERSGQPTLAK